MSAFIAIQAALSANLATAAPVSVNRLQPIASQQTTAIVVRLEKTEAQEFVLGTLDWRSTFLIECYARVPAEAEPAAAVDPLVSEVWLRLAALDAASLGIGVMSITQTPQIDWQYDDGDTPSVCAVLRLSLSHRTSTASLVASP